MGSMTEVSKKSGNQSIVFLKFKFDRTLGFYILQIYIPLTIIVMSSWVCFLLHNVLTASLWFSSGGSKLMWAMRLLSSSMGLSLSLSLTAEMAT